MATTMMVAMGYTTSTTMNTILTEDQNLQDLHITDMLEQKNGKQDTNLGIMSMSMTVGLLKMNWALY